MKQKILFSILVIIFLLPTLVFAVPGIVISNQLTAQFAVEELTVTLGDMPEWINTDSIEIIGSYSGNGITKIELLITRDDQAEPVQELMFDVESRTFSGAYAFPADGVYRFQTVITDLYNNTALSSAAVVKRDSIPPSLGVYCPVAITRNPSVLIKITSEPGAGIYVNGIKRPGSVDEDGSLDVVVDLAVGKNVISFQVEDRAGNRSERIEIYVTRQAGTSSGGGGGGAVQPSAVPALEDKLTLDDHLIYNSLDKTGSAVLSLADRSDGRVVISIAVIREMVMKNLSLTLLGEGIELFFAPMCFITDEIMAAPLGYDAFLELVIREATEEEKTGVFSQVKPGENTGLFDIGGRVFKMEARVYWTNPDGTQTIHPV